ncbi:hypothetical protein EWM62_17075 [Mucilaginibacter terrigena]|uniref:Outer membrane protein beta-barrel domain-containing protein n=1 Tax=Mucilaginibacter terrigena TaxID=2492395 RepID=A0A4Q5LJD1_9SPHI|nr:hypothetical protein [Mucilaginibacter terrigena]RYU86864.1 hypothetical protein EWM62_17075 [Mucilaginibacter terrigena]
MRSIFLLGIAFLLSLSVSAQSNYKPALLISTTGDTTRGVINYRGWEANPEYIEFKSTLADEGAKKIKPADIAAFEVIGLAAYKSYTGPISIDNTSDNLSSSRDTSFKIDVVFLKVLQKGKNITLYSYQDIIKTRYFIGAGHQLPTELIYRLHYANGQQSNTIAESTYKKQLSIVASNLNLLNDKLNMTIQRSEYSYQDILGVVSKINERLSAKEDNVIDANYFYVGAGANISSFTTGGEYKKAGGKPYNSIMPAFVAGLNVYANPNAQNVAFRVEFGIGANKYESNYKNQVSPYNDVVFHFTQLSFSITPQVVYNFYNKPDLKFYAAIGGQISINTYLNKAFRNKDGSEFRQFAGPTFNFYKASFNPIIIKTGFTINKKIDVFAMYTPPNNINVDPYFVISYSTLQAGVAYLFK